MFFRSEGFKSMDITTAITIIGSFGAASTAQIVNHGVCQHSCRINYFSILKDSSNLKFNQATALRLLAC